MRLEQLRREFPVFEKTAYLNAGTCGPLPAGALRAGADEALRAAQDGRTLAYFQQSAALLDSLRTRYARVLAAEARDVSVTTCASDGMVRVLAGLRLGPGDEVLTAPDEHPGLLGPLAALRDQAGVKIRTAPLERIVEAVEPTTTLVAVSHVNWVTGALAPAGLADVGRSIPVLLDGAQGGGAVPVDVQSLGCAAYAAAGQKWLCGPIGSGILWIAPQWRQRIAATAPIYGNLSDPAAGLAAEPWPDGRAFDSIAFAGQSLAAADAAAALLESVGWDVVWERAASLAQTLAERLTSAGRTVAPRGRTTLVSWEDPDPAGSSRRLAAAGVTVRDIPRTPFVRASVGAWNTEEDLDHLLAALS